MSLKSMIDKILKITQLAPKDAVTIFEKAKKCFRNKEYAKAFQYFKESHDLDPKNPEYLRGMGDSLALQEKNTKAVDYLLQAVDLAPKDTSCLCDAGRILIKLNRYKDARQCFTKAIEVEPEEQGAIVGLADCAAGERNYTEALSFYHKIIEPDCGVYFGMTLCYSNLGMHAEARDSRDRCLALSPPPVIVEILERLSKHYGL